MSIKFHGFIVPKDRWWEFTDGLKKHLYTSYSLVSIATSVDQQVALRVECFERGETPPTFDGQLNALKRLLDTEGFAVRLQVFDDGGTHYAFRVLSQGYAVEDVLWKRRTKKTPAWVWLATRMDYDNRADIPRRDRKWRKAVLRISDDVEAGRYFVQDLVTFDSLEILFVRTIWAAADKLRAMGRDPKTGGPLPI